MILGISASSSSTTPSSASSPSSSQESTSENNDSVSEMLRLQYPKSNKGMNEELRGDPLHAFLQVFRENLVDESTSEGRTCCRGVHTLPVPLMILQWSREHAWNRPGSGKHNVFTHFPKDPNCEICLKTKITRASCRRRANAVMPRAENFGDLITADHKVLSDDNKSRNNHRYAVVVQDLATQWLQSYPCRTKSSQETSKKPVFDENWTCLNAPWKKFLRKK